jgi:hypothetical protein
MPLAYYKKRVIVLVMPFIFQVEVKSQYTQLHLSIGNNGYLREFYEPRKKVKHLVIINALTWETQFRWVNDEKIKYMQHMPADKKQVLEKFPSGNYYLYADYDNEYSCWKKFSVKALPKSYLTLYPGDTTTYPITLSGGLTENNDSLKISISSITCDAHNLNYFILKKTTSGYWGRIETYQVEHGPSGIGIPIFICREPVKSSRTLHLDDAMLSKLDQAFNLSLVEFAGDESYHNYYECKIGKRQYITGEKSQMGPLEIYFRDLFR